MILFWRDYQLSASYACVSLQEHDKQQQFSAELLKCIAEWGVLFFIQNMPLSICFFLSPWKKTAVPSRAMFGLACKVSACLSCLQK